MRKKNIITYTIFSTFFIFIMGIVLHFIYNLSNNNSIISIVYIFVIFTFFPPHINLLIDPITKTYGIYNNK